MQKGVRECRILLGSKQRYSRTEVSMQKGVQKCLSEPDGYQGYSAGRCRFRSVEKSTGGFPTVLNGTPPAGAAAKWCLRLPKGAGRY